MLWVGVRRCLLSVGCCVFVRCVVCAVPVVDYCLFIVGVCCFLSAVDDGCCLLLIVLCRWDLLFVGRCLFALFVAIVRCLLFLFIVV